MFPYGFLVFSLGSPMVSLCFRWFSVCLFLLFFCFVAGGAGAGLTVIYNVSGPGEGRVFFSVGGGFLLDPPPTPPPASLHPGRGTGGWAGAVNVTTVLHVD